LLRKGYVYSRLNDCQPINAQTADRLSVPYCLCGSMWRIM